MKVPFYLNNPDQKSILLVTAITSNDSEAISHFTNMCNHVDYHILLFTTQDLLYTIPPIGDHVSTDTSFQPSMFSRLMKASVDHPEYTHYAWIDPKSQKALTNMPCCIDASRLGNRAVFHCVPSILFYHSFVVPKNLVQTIGNILYHDNEITSLNILAFSRPDLFELIDSDGELFSLFRKHFNRSVVQSFWNCRDRYQVHEMLTRHKGVYAEVGVFKGEYSRYLLGSTSCSKIILVDPYINYSGYDDGINSMNMEAVLATAMANVDAFPGRYEFLRKTSIEAARDIPDESLDFIYIDGNHAYDYVYEDMEAWWPKLRKGGFMVCDDCYHRPLGPDGKNSYISWGPKDSFGFYGVHRASIDFSKKYNLHPVYFSTQVCFRKEEDVLFVTAYKDIGRSTWSTFRRDVHNYLQSFRMLASGLRYPIVVYLEKYLHSLVSLRPGMILMDLNEVDTFLKRYEETEQTIINSEMYQNLVPDRRKNNPEHLYASYNLINHSKVNFLKHSKDTFPMYEHYIWIDFGSIRTPVHIPGRLDISKLSNKVMYHGLDPLPKNDISPDKMLSVDNVYIMGSMFATHRDILDEYVQRYDLELQYWHTIGVSDDDQNMVYQLYRKYPEMFELVKGREWFTFFSDYLNYK